jgi:general secretion pathway protein I
VRSGQLPVRWCQGFTLIEVLVALFIVALGIGALLTTLTSAATTVDHLRDKSFAEWVALNRISDVRLGTAPVVDGTSSGDTEFAGATWHWQQVVADQGIAGIRRIEVAVSRGAAADGPALATAVGFAGLAVARSSGIDPDWTLESLAGGGPGGDGEKKP